MWKKFLVILIVLVGTFTAGYAYFNYEMSAAVTPFQLQKGQKVVLGKYNNKEVVWDIGNNTSDYVLMSSKPIVDSIAVYDSSIPETTTLQNGAVDINSFCLKQYIGANYIFLFCPTQSLVKEIMKVSTNNNENTIITKAPFLPSVDDVYTGGTLGLSLNDRAYKSTVYYWLNGTINYLRDPQTAYYNAVQTPLGTGAARDDFLEIISGNSIPKNDLISAINSRGWSNEGGKIFFNSLRPFALVDKSRIVFAANTLYTDGNWHNYVIDTSNLNENNELNPNKLRIQSSLTASLQDIQRNSHSTQRVAKNSEVTLSVNANTGSNTKISVIVYDSTGTDIKYYRMLSSTIGGVNDYTLDLTSIPTGSYQIAVINEEYDSSSNLPVESSPISNLMPLEIVDPLSNLSFTPRTNLTYDSNVNVGDTVGTISSQNGAGTITYTIIADPSYPNEYQNLTLASDGKTVIVDGNPLNAGTYHFKIQAQDENNDPNPALTINASITVKQSSTTIAFDDPNQTKKSIIDAMIDWSETATAIPNGNDIKITYAKVSGDVSLINIDPNTGAIRYTGVNAYGKVTIKATADDDPTSGHDDYIASDATKEIVIYREVDGSVTPHANSSDANIPTFTASDTNIKINGVIGKIVGSMGTPDQVTSGGTTYTYGINNSGDGSFFTVNSNTGEIKTNANLGVGSYNITVTVSDKWSTKDIPLTINVGMAPAEDLKFYENSTSNTVINTKAVNFTDTNVNVFATVKGSSNSNPVKYEIKDGSTNVIEINPTSGAITIKGSGTVTIVATKQGASGQADARAELTFTVTVGSQNFIYTTDSTLQTEMPKTGNYYNAYKETYAPNKTFKVYTTGNAQGTNVTYKLKDGSPMDVISVDSDGTVHILNASTNTQIGKVIVQATSHDPNGNYDDKMIELPINIDKGTRTITFAENPINVVNGTGSITPNVLVDGSIDTDGNTTIEIDPSEDSSIAWTNDGTTIEYEWEEEKGKDIKLHVTKPADRNYKAAEADGKLHILGADENVLTLSTPGKVTYGDHFTIRSTQDDSMSTNVQYTFETDNGVYISAPKINGNKAEFDALRYSGSTEITIKVTRTADGELPLTKRVKIKVLPKPITIQIEDKEKLRLQENPELTYKDFSGKLVTWNGVKDEIETSVIKLTTSAGKYSPVGSYPITSKAEKLLNDNYPNYKFTIQIGKLNIKDNGDKNFWDIDNDGCPDMNIEIKNDQGETILINGDKNDDGIPDYNVDINGDSKPDLNIDTDNDGKPDVNLVILKSWKPSKCVVIGDIQYASGITAKAEINVDIDGDWIPDINIDNNGDMKADINISKDGKTPIINIAVIHDWKPVKDYKADKFLYDSIGKEDAVPELNIDTDGDGRPDINLDLDHDGIPDLNIDWDGDWIPDTQIDSDGDGKPDINIDTDGNGIPDENIVEIEEWKPNKNVDGELPYDTMDFSKTDDPTDPNDKDGSNNSDQPNGSTNDTNHPNDNDQTGNDTDVKGAYYPGKDVGGAMTGDESHLYLYACILFLSLGNLCYLYNKAVNRIKTK